MSVAIQQMFNRIAPTYDKVNRVLSVGIDQSWRKVAIASLLLPRGRARARAIDLCAGTLDLSALLLREGDGVQVQAIDFSAAMLRKGLAKLPEHLPAADLARLSVLAADATALPLVSGEADALVCGFGIRNVDRDKLSLALRETRRVLRPGGRLAVLEFFRPERPLTRAAHWLYNRHVLPTVGGMISGDRTAYRYLVSSIEGFLTTQEFAQLLTGAGFADIKTQDLTLGIASLVTAAVPLDSVEAL